MPLPSMPVTGNEQVYGLSLDYRNPLLVRSDILHQGKLPTKASLLTLYADNGKGMQIACLKQAEDGQGLILRLWNSGERREVKINSAFNIKEITSVNLNEAEVTSNDLHRSGTVLPAHGLATLRIKIEGT